MDPAERLESPPARVADAPQASLRLVVALGRALVADYRFVSPIVTIGRDPDQDVCLNDASVSRQHCRIRRESLRYALHDLGTSNGTTVNGRAAVLQRLLPGDEIGVGRFVLLFHPTDEQLKRLEYQVAPEKHQDPKAQTTYLSHAEIDLVRRSNSEERSAHLKVVGAHGGRMGKRFPLLQPTNVLGRALDADVPLLGAFIARRHAIVVKNRDRYRLQRVGGFRGVYVNGRQVRDCELHNRDQIRIGPCTFQFFDAMF